MWGGRSNYSGGAPLIGHGVGGGREGWGYWWGSPLCRPAVWWPRCCDQTPQLWPVWPVWPWCHHLGPVHRLSGLGSPESLSHWVHLLNCDACCSGAAWPGVSWLEMVRPLHIIRPIVTTIKLNHFTSLVFVFSVQLPLNSHIYCPLVFIVYAHFLYFLNIYFYWLIWKVSHQI